MIILGRFDLNCLLPEMMKWIKNNGYTTNLIMKGNKLTYMQLVSPGEEVILGFKDVLEYTVPVPLSKFLKQWKIPEAKGIFPHA